jgi:GWxTD domain-containing protein
MRFLESWVTTPLAHALGWTLLHSLWEGAIISALLGTALWATRSARARYAAACAAMLVMLGAIGLTLVRVMPERVHGLPGVATTALPLWSVPPDLAAAGPSRSYLAAVVPWLAPFWIAGVWIFALGQVAGWIWVSRLRRRGVCCAPERWQKEIERLSARLRGSKPVQLLESCLADVPMVVGHIRPVILMPIGLLAGLPPGQIEAILLHELAHIRRYDYLVNVMQRAAECLLFYHPAVWWISRVIRAERENSCDDAAVAASGSAREYAAALAALEQRRWPDWQAAVASTGGSLVKRIRRLLYPNAANGAWTPLFAAAIVITTAVVTLAAWPAKPHQQHPAATPGQRSRAETSSDSNWANEAVSYITTEQERAAFKRLTTDEERERFIEQFWERRNPNPGSPENAFKHEFYRRVAYANRHFASTTTPGWKTDRGRIYIIYGPPDEIDAHPSGGAYERAKAGGGGKVVGYPFEVWRYAHFQFSQGVGSLTLEFVDESSSGDYHMTLDRGKGDYEVPPPGRSGFKPAHKQGEAQPRSSNDNLAPRAKDRDEVSPYDKWLNEEVVYIITEQESAAFQQLTADDEREKFLAEFWERRNPTPGSPQNEFKEEHYRRIAYANEHFASNFDPGWKTARGHMYILFGPPDEIDSHPDGPPYPFEEWRYRHAGELGDNVVLTFIDPTRDGTFRIAPGPPR